MFITECAVLGKDLVIGKERNIPKHQELHQKLKFPLLPNLNL